MTGAAEEPDERIDDRFFGELADLTHAEAIEALHRKDAWLGASALRLADAALEAADVSPDRAIRLLSLAREIQASAYDEEDAAARIDYAAARICVQQGDLAQAEGLLRSAQARFQDSGLGNWLTRSHLGLTQVLAMQGRYGEAEQSVRIAIAGMEAMAGGDMLMTARAYRNLATLLLFQERHGEALAEFERSASLLQAAAGSGGLDAPDAALQMELAHISLNRATALTFLDRPDDAEAALASAIEHFSVAGDTVNRGRARTNLGRLLLRTGRFSAALAAFDQAASDLIGDLPLRAVPDVEELRQADELLLEHANAYIALNLLPEAGLALDRCETLFRESGQPYALGHTRYAQGLLLLHGGRLGESRRALEEASALFERLDNPLWANRTAIAMAALAYQAGDRPHALVMADRLLAATPAMPSGSAALAWDVFSLAEARLLRIRLRLGAGEVDGAREDANRLEEELGKPAMAPGAVTLPHLRLRLEHAKGQIEFAAGARAAAERHYSAAIALLESQRVSLALEEQRTAFLSDKSALFSDLVVSLLDGEDGRGENTARAFDVVERARSRAFLERLYASMDEAVIGAKDDFAQQREALRRQLHWHYNQMTTPGAAAGETLRALEAAEAALQALEWRSAPELAQALPVDAADLQRAMAADEEALVYYAVDGKFMAFHVTRGSIVALRDLCDVSEVEAAHRELQFQLGRAELGRAYWARHAARFERMLLETLGRLHRLLIAPVLERLQYGRLIVVPYGVLHLLPFHAFWDGERYLVEQTEVRYAPSASIAVQCMAATSAPEAYLEFAGLAPDDETIPQAVVEVERAAVHFAKAQVYTGRDATRRGLAAAARQGDVLHLATHGLFRPDNSFFSALKLADGWVDVRELYQLQIGARLVVLSACESGAGEIRGGDEVVGLVRGFLVAGARRLVVSLWNVHDATSADLMDGFYGRLTAAGAEGPAAALRMTQLAAIAEGVHPYFWAPYTMVG